MERWQFAEHLCQLPDEELVAVLQRVFAARVPYPREQGYNRSRFFLGLASSDLESDKGEQERWGPWRIAAVASPDPAHYGDDLGPDWGLCQFGTCRDCGFDARSNLKNGICSICGAQVYMT